MLRCNFHAHFHERWPSNSEQCTANVEQQLIFFFVPFHCILQVFATCSTFYVPLLVILVLYWKIYQTARKRIHRRRPKQIISANNNQVIDFAMCTFFFSISSLLFVSIFIQYISIFCPKTSTLLLCRGIYIHLHWMCCSFFYTSAAICILSYNKSVI